MIDIVTTACRRPEILERTLASFDKNLFWDTRPDLILNIDPVGPSGVDATLSVARYYFHVAFVRTPPEPSFGAAFKWVWSQAEHEFVFHLEDDWELIRPVDLGRMIKFMEHNPDLAVLRLPWKPTGLKSMKNWKYFFPWNGEFFECPGHLKREVGFCGHPSLIRGEFVRNTVEHIDGDRNPEKQFHHGHPELMKEVDKWRYGVFAEPGQPPAIRDIGRRWMINNGLKKAGNKAFFTQWERINA